MPQGESAEFEVEACDVQGHLALPAELGHDDCIMLVFRPTNRSKKSTLANRRLAPNPTSRRDHNHRCGWELITKRPALASLSIPTSCRNVLESA